MKTALLVACLSTAAASAQSVFTVHPDKPKQVIKGIGFEIQSDSIGSGNHGLPQEPIAVPHDLIPSERDRLAKEMLKGFRYCRLAGGLYWRGTDPAGKVLQPRWPEQLKELRELLDSAGVEGVSLEYWSPAPYWKANRSYVALEGPNGRAMNRLRCFAADFDKDPDYQGDAQRFLKDFGNAVVTDIKTLKDAGIRTSMFGLQNEPNVNHTIYSTCEYPTSEQYVQAYCAVATAVRTHDPAILLFADTEHGYPKKIGPAMNDPEVAALVDAYAVHIVGSPSTTPIEVYEKIRKTLPLRPWFQNEYEYLTGGATRERCLNTVEHIMNSFQLAENPTWFWIHCLKPLKNAEASGYALGFWKSQIEPSAGVPAEQPRRWPEGPAYTALPKELESLEMVSAKFDRSRPAVGYNFIVNQPVTIYLLVQQCDDLNLDAAWTVTDLTAKWEGGTDRVFERTFKNGTIDIPPSRGKVDGRPAAPHLALVKPSDEKTLKISIGMNLPIEIRSQALALQRQAAAIEPGHWVFNPYNWNAVGSFVRHMPWDSTAIAISEATFDAKARLLAFRKPDGKLCIVVSNSSATDHSFEVTGLPDATWKGVRYTPDEAGTDSMGVPLEAMTGNGLKPTLPPLSWEFWSQQ
jgi:hypothetical protein